MDGAKKQQATQFKEQGNAALKQKNPQLAIEMYTKAISLCDTDATFFCNRAAVYLELENYELAKNDCMEAIKLEPNNIKARYRLGICYTKLLQFVNAEKHLQVAMKLDPNNTQLNEAFVNMKFASIRHGMPIFTGESKKKKKLATGKKQHCANCAALEDVSCAKVLELGNEKRAEWVAKIGESIEALVLLSTDPQGSVMLLQEPHVARVRQVLGTSMDEGAKIIANCCALNAAKKNTAMDEIVQLLIDTVLKVEFIHQHPQVIRVIANIVNENSKYAELMKPVLEPLLNSLQKHAITETIRCLACFASVPSLSKHMYTIGVSRECHLFSKNASPEHEPLLSAVQHWMNDNYVQCTKDGDYSYLNISSVANECTDFNPVSVALRPKQGNQFFKHLVGTTVMANVANEGVVRIATSFNVTNKWFFMQCVYCPISSEARDIFLINVPKSAVDMIAESYAQFWRNNSIFTKYPQIPIANVPIEDVTEIMRIGCSKRSLDKEEQAGLLFLLSMSPLHKPTSATSVVEFYQTKLKKPASTEYKFSFSQWRSILASDAFGEWGFKQGDLIEMGTRIEDMKNNYYPHNSFDMMPSPSLAAKDWITLTLHLARGCKNAVQMLLGMFGHVAYFYKHHGNLDIANDACLAFYHVLEKQDYTTCPPIVAYVERTIYFCNKPPSSVPVLLQLYKQQGLPVVISQVIDSCRNAMPTQLFPRYNIVEPLVNYIMFQITKYKTKQANFKPSKTALAGFLSECFKKKLAGSVDEWCIKMLCSQNKPLAQMICDVWDEINLDQSKCQYGNFEEFQDIRNANIEQHPELHKVLNTCERCGAQASSNCSKCKKVKYCSKDCQVKHWPEHKKQCK